jgi:hypothetical protein
MSISLDHPAILYEGAYSATELQQFKDTQRIWQVVDIFEQQLRELFEILHPAQRQASSYADALQTFVEQRSAGGLQGNWIYYPWNGCLVHAVNQAEYLALRSNRNKNLITHDEQERLFQTCIAVAGLSIGTHIVEGLAYNGIAHTMKLAEYDTLDTSNLNRLRAGLKDVGETKITLAARRIYEIHPYAELSLYPGGLTPEVLPDFLSGTPQPQLVFEAIDDFKMKIRVRIAARRAHIPLIMLTNLGDTILVDIERYDLDPTLPLFNGLIGQTPEKILQAEMTEADKIRYAIDIVGREHLPPRVLQTLSEINRTLVGRPQLYSTVAAGGGLASYLARRLLLDQPLPGGRYLLSLEQALQLCTHL